MDNLDKYRLKVAEVLEKEANKPLEDLPIGTIRGSYTPDVFPKNWLPCDGCKLKKTLYKELFNHLCNHTNILEDQEYFAIPDLRGAPFMIPNAHIKVCNLEEVVI